MIKSILKYSVAFSIITLLLVPKFPFFNIRGSQVAIRIEDLVLLVTYFFLLVVIFRDIKTFIRDNINQTIFIYLSVGFVSLLSAIFITRTVIPSVGLLHFFRRIEYMGLFFAGVYSIKKTDDLAFYIKIFLLCLIYLFVVGIGQRYLNWPIITTQNYEYAKGVALFWVPGAHIPSTFAGHYDLASFLVTILPLLIGLIFGPETVLKELGFKTKLSFFRLIFLGLFCAGFWLMINAAQRISIISYIVGISIVMIYLRKYKFLFVVLAVSLIFISLSSKLMDRYLQLINVAGKKITEVALVSVYAQDFKTQRINSQTPTPLPIQVLEDRSTSIRFNVEWPRATRALKKNPLLGTGFSSITLATDNDFLRMLGETGILGFLALCFVLLEIVLQGFKRFPLEKSGILETYILAYLAAIPGILLLMFFIDILEASKYATFFWFLSGAFVASTRILEKKNNEY